MSTKILDKSGLAYFWGKIKAWCNATFAAITHSHVWSTITGKPTTISGYGITDAKIDNGTITLGSNNITPLTSHQDISGKVSKSGDTMTGNLIITNSKTLQLKHTGITRGTAPSANVYSFFVLLKDNANKILGGLYYTYDKNKVAQTYLMCYQGTSNANTYQSIGVGYDASGDVFTWAPTPAIADDSTKIATTAWCRTATGNFACNAATASAVAWSGVTSKPTTIAGYGITDAKIANGTITIGSNSITPLTSHQTLPTLSRTISGSGNAITDITVSGHAITATKGSTFLTSHQSLSHLVPQAAVALPTGNLTQDGLQLVEVYNNGYPITYGNVINVQGSAHKGAGQLLLGWAASNNGIANIYYRNKRDAATTWSDWKQIAFTDSNITGNATTATKLATAREINGVSFDGSADVTLTAVVSSASRSADIAAKGTFTVPSYIVGAQALLVYLDGCLSRQGDGWSEVGKAGTASTTIKFLQLIPKAMEIVVRVN